MEDMFFHNIDKYVYDECTKEEMELFKQHMENCAECKAEYELSCSVRDAMHSMRNTTPPADLSKLINERLDRETPAKKVSFISAGCRKYSAVAACLVLAAVIGAENINLTDNAPLESTTVIDNSLQSMPDTTEATVQDVILPQPAVEEVAPAAPATKAPVRKASTKKITHAAVPAATQKPVVAAPAAEQSYNNDDVMSKIPPHLDPSKNVVLASSVEKKYEISGINPENYANKERNLEAEFALLETTKSGVIVANAATMSSLDGVRFGADDSAKNSKDYGIGSGSIFISSKDKMLVDELLIKYISVEEGGCCFLTGDNFENFIEEMNSRGISFEERLLTEKGGNVAIKVVVV